VHVEQLGLVPSHLSFLFLQITHAIRFGLGIPFSCSPARSADSPSSSSLGVCRRLLGPALSLVFERSLKKSSGGVFELDDIAGTDFDVAGSLKAIFWGTAVAGLSIEAQQLVLGSLVNELL
jgi:hypothetical protein